MSRRRAALPPLAGGIEPPRVQPALPIWQGWAARTGGVSNAETALETP
jgi:hypothetical protein